MPTYYVDPAAAGDHDGSSWTHAWPTLQEALDTASTAGDIVYCRGHEDLAVVIDVDLAVAGTNAGGFIKVIGCNAGGTVDGTRYVIDAAGGAAHHGLTFAATPDLYWFENIEVINAGAAKHGWNMAGYSSTGCVFINCCANGCGDAGFYIDGGAFATFLRCLSYNNVNGFSNGPSNQRLLFCNASANSGVGFHDTAGTLIGCIAHGNTDDGVNLFHGSFMMNCVVDGNTDDGIVNNASALLYHAILIGNRITNHSGAGDIGINCNDEVVVMGWNYFDANTDDIYVGAGAGIQQSIPEEGGTTDSNRDSETQDDNDCGYADSASHDFSTKYVDATDPVLRRTAITIPEIPGW